MNPMKTLFLIGMVIVIGGTWLKISSLNEVEGNAPRKEEGEENEKQSGADRQMSSWWWSRAYPDPANLNQKFYSAWLQAQAMKNPELMSGANGIGGTNNTNLFSGNWSGIGPDQNIGGRILSIAIDPANGNNLFIGSASGGIWKSTSGGLGPNAWQHVTTNFPVLGVACIIIDPSNSNVIYAGTGEVYRTDNSNIGFNVWKAGGTYGVGILKSIDGGNTWAQVFDRKMSDLFAVQAMAFDPANSNIIYACATDGLYRSSNAGVNWIKILNKKYVSDLVINPSNSNQLVAAVGNLSDS